MQHIYLHHSLLYFVIADHNKSNNLPEFKIFQQYYSKLVDCLPAKELSHYLVSQGVIALIENEDIISPNTSRHRATELLLSKVSLFLQEGNALPFKKLLDVMQKHGGDATVSLSSEIQKLLNKNNSKSKTFDQVLHVCLSTMFVLYV